MVLLFFHHYLNLTFQGHLLARPRQNAVAADNEKLEELKRIVIRVLLALKVMPTHERLPKLNELMDYVSKEFGAVLADVKAERSNQFW